MICSKCGSVYTEDLNYCLKAPDQAFNELRSALDEGTPLVIDVNGVHAINAIKLIQDNEDANAFKIEVYDNNYPGEVKYIEVVRSKYSKFQLNFTAWQNEYSYKFFYDANNDEEKEETTITLHYSSLSE